MHTSIPLDALELTRIGVAGINVGSGRIKIARLPVRADDAGEKSLHKRAQRANDRRRAGSVFAFLRQVVEGDVDESS